MPSLRPPPPPAPGCPPFCGLGGTSPRVPPGTDPGGTRRPLTTLAGAEHIPAGRSLRGRLPPPSLLSPLASEQRKLPALSPVPVAGKSSPLLFAPLCPGLSEPRALSGVLGRPEGESERRGPTLRFSLAGRRAGAQRDWLPPPSRWSCVYWPGARTFIALDGNLSSSAGT